MNILTFTNCPLDPSIGSGKTVINFTEGLRKLGNKVDLYSPKDYDFLTITKRAYQFRQSIGSYYYFNHKISNLNFDIFEFYGAEFWIISRLLSKSKTRPLIIAHTNGIELLANEKLRIEYTTNHPILNYLYNLFSKHTHQRFSRIAFQSADAFVCLCHQDRDYVIENGLFHPENIHIVPPGLDEEFHSIENRRERSKKISFTGSWIERKGISVLVSVITKLLSNNPEFTFDIYGTGVSKNIILSYFAVKIHNQIKIHNKLTNKELAESLSKSRVFFFPSKYEGFGIALAEAMACGCAPVTTPTGYGAEIENGHEGFVFDFDDEDSMYSKILEIMNNDNLFHSISNNARSRARTLNWKSSVSELNEIYWVWNDKFKTNRNRNNQ